MVQKNYVHINLNPVFAIAFNETEPSAKTNTEILNKTILIKKYISNKVSTCSNAKIFC